LTSDEIMDPVREADWMSRMRDEHFSHVRERLELVRPNLNLRQKFLLTLGAMGTEDNEVPERSHLSLPDPHLKEEQLPELVEFPRDDAVHKNAIAAIINGKIDRYHCDQEEVPGSNVFDNWYDNWFSAPPLGDVLDSFHSNTEGVLLQAQSDIHNNGYEWIERQDLYLVDSLFVTIRMMMFIGGAFVCMNILLMILAV